MGTYMGGNPAVRRRTLGTHPPRRVPMAWGRCWCWVRRSIRSGVHSNLNQPTHTAQGPAPPVEGPRGRGWDGARALRINQQRAGRQHAPALRVCLPLRPSSVISISSCRRSIPLQRPGERLSPRQSHHDRRDSRNPERICIPTATHASSKVSCGPICRFGELGALLSDVVCGRLRFMTRRRLSFCFRELSAAERFEREPIPASSVTLSILFLFAGAFPLTPR